MKSSSFNPFLSQQTKTEAIKTQENDRSNLMGDNRQNQDISGLNKKTKSKPSLHLTVSQTEPNNKVISFLNLLNFLDTKNPEQ